MITTTSNNRARKLFMTPLIVFSFLVTLNGCVTAIVATAAIATVDIIHDRRTAGEYIDDNTIELRARQYLVSTPELRNSTHVKVTSWNGILLLTGAVDNEQLKQGMITNFQGIDGVRQMVDETNISDKSKLWDRSKDAWITTKVKSKLLSKTGLDANRVKVVTTRGSVYLMGIVSPDEALRATEIARSIKGVTRVVKVFEHSGAPN